MPLDPAFSTGIAMAVEVPLNALLRHSLKTQKSIEKLELKVMTFCFQAPEFNLSFQVLNQEFSVSTLNDTQATCKIEGSALSFINLMMTSKHTLVETGLNVSGEVALLENYQQVFKELSFDWENISRSIINSAFNSTANTSGAEPRNKNEEDDIVTAVSNKLKVGGYIARSYAKDIQEGLGKHLSPSLPATVTLDKKELKGFYGHVDELKADTERIAARVQRLMTQIRQNKKNNE